MAEAGVVSCLACDRGGRREAYCLGLLEEGAAVSALRERRRSSGREEVLDLLDRGWDEGEEGEDEGRFESVHSGCDTRLMSDNSY